MANISWTKIELTTCGAKGQFGPSLEDCISTYNSDWSNNRKLFDVDPSRKGIQKIRIAENGSYEIKAWGAGNRKKLVQEMDFVLIITKIYIFNFTNLFKFFISKYFKALFCQRK